MINKGDLLGGVSSQVIVGDSKDKLAGLPNECVDLVVTDPPYGYSFMGKDWDKALPDIDIFEECLRVLKPGAFAFVMAAPRQDVLSRMMVLLEDAGFNINFTSIYWTYANGFPKAQNIGKAVDKKLGKERKIICKHPTTKNASVGTTSIYSQIKPDGMPVFITAPASEEAKQLDGSYGGFQPKPAVEVIIVVQKPNTEKTQVGQALANGKGITWLDGCRIPYLDNDTTAGVSTGLGGFGHRDNTYGNNSTTFSGGYIPSQQGRFPANLLVSDNIIGEEYSRFFSLDAWVERNLPFLIVPKASKKEKNAGCENIDPKQAGDTALYDKCIKCGRARKASLERGCKCEEPEWVKVKYHNNHPTVKPIKLMSYLITMGSREGDVVLDPFMGSGSTGCAAELLKRNFIGIELSEEYVEIAKARIEHHKRLIK